MSGTLTVLVFVLDFAARLMLAAAILLRSRGTPSVRLAWLVVLFALPLLGGIVYLLLGDVRLGRRRVGVRPVAGERLGLDRVSTPPVAADIPEPYLPIAHLGESVGGHLPQGGHELRLFGETNLFIQSLIEDIDRAAGHCHLLFYIFLTDHSGHRVAEALMRAAGRGVACRLLVDAVGSAAFVRSPLRREMEHGGVKVAVALPVNMFRTLLARIDHRNHRKIAVIDGLAAYTGSQNIADADFAIKRKYAPWVDAMIRLEGPAVRDLQALFVRDWFLDTDESLKDVLAVVPPASPGGAAIQILGTGPDAYNAALVQMTQATFHAAREELIMTTPYFVPDDATLSAMLTTARRGVDVALVVPARNDSPLVAAASRSYYEALLAAGVQIHEYREGLLHAKTVTLDRRFAMVSTANLDRRSFELNFEVTAVVYDDDFASEVRFLQKSYIQAADAVRQTAWERRPWTSRLWQNAVGLLGPLL